jgi:hypothetical protein
LRFIIVIFIVIAIAIAIAIAVFQLATIFQVPLYWKKFQTNPNRIIKSPVGLLGEE